MKTKTKTKSKLIGFKKKSASYNQTKYPKSKKKNAQMFYTFFLFLNSFSESYGISNYLILLPNYENRNQSSINRFLYFYFILLFKANAFLLFWIRIIDGYFSFGITIIVIIDDLNSS